MDFVSSSKNITAPHFAKEAIKDVIKKKFLVIDNERFEQSFQFISSFIPVSNNYSIPEYILMYCLNEFIRFYELQLTNENNLSTIFNAFKRMEISTISKNKWFAGINDAFSQTTNEKQFWEDDDYFAGYQKGLTLFRNLLKESKKLFPSPEISSTEQEIYNSIKEIINKIKEH